MEDLKDLVRAELDSKLNAISGYDGIIWKIRAGYVVILYGSLALILGTKGIDIEGIGYAQIAVALMIVVFFSVSAIMIDQSFVEKKLKVVISRDQLIEARANHTFHHKELLPLLHISGEELTREFPGSKEVRRRLRSEGLRIIAPLYLASPVLIVIFAISRVIYENLASFCQ